MTMRMRPETWIRPTPQGLYVEPGDFFIDPVRPAARAVVTHGHADPARPGNESVLATAGTLAIMRARYGALCSHITFPLPEDPADDALAAAAIAELKA